MEHTIAAISTSTMSSGGISIVRLSGVDAVEIADKIFEAKNKKKLKDARSHTIHYGVIKDGDEVIDEVLVSVMRAPDTYTREDVIEINCHGGILVTRRVLDTVLKNGAKPAEPGEFTKRAFLNGRIDLSQAEAVIDIINARNDYALKSSVNQLGGKLSEKIKKIRKRARNVNTMNEKLAALGRPDSSFLAEAKAEAKALTVGRTEFLKATGWRSEPAYKKAMAASGQFMYHYHLCCESNEDFRRQMDRFDELLEEKNLHLDRFGVSIDPSMALPRDIRAENRQGGSLYFESQADWDMLGMSRRMQPHLGDNMLGSPASVETVSCALKAGVTTIGNLSQFFGWDYPQFPDTAARAKATASAMAIMAEHAADGALIHSNLDDGYGDKAPDMGLLAGCALLEKYIADLLGAKLAHSFGDMFHSPYKRLVFLSALCRIHPEGMTGSMIFANKLGRSHTDIELNTAHMTTCLLYDMAGQRVYRTGHAVTTLANQGLTTDTTPEQVVRTLEYAREMEAYVPAVIETIDFAKVDRDADMLVARGKRFVEATLEYLANYIDVTDPYAMLLAVKTAGVGNLTAAFADRDGRSAVPTDYCLMHE